MVINGGNRILEKTGTETGYNDVKFYKNVIALEKSKNKFLI